MALQALFCVSCVCAAVQEAKHGVQQHGLLQCSELIIMLQALVSDADAAYGCPIAAAPLPSQPQYFVARKLVIPGHAVNTCKRSLKSSTLGHV